MGVGGRIRRLLLWAVVPLALFGALACWAVSSPLGSSPDEDYHLTSIWCGSGIDDGVCEPGLAPDERLVPRGFLESPCFAFNPNVSASCGADPSSMLVNTDRGNFDATYPPVFYSAMHTLAGNDHEASVIAMRLANALFFVAAVTATFFLLSRGSRGPFVWATMATIVPLGMFIVPSINPSSWAVTSAATLWVALLAYATATEKRRRIGLGALSVVMTLVAAGARADAALYCILAVVVVQILTFDRARTFTRASFLPLALVVIAGAFFLTSGQGSALDPGNAPGESTTGFVPLVLANLVQLPSLWTGSLGTWGLGWLDTAMPAVVWVSTVAVFFGLIFWGLQKFDRRKALAVGLVAVSLVVVPMYMLVKDEVVVGAGVQPRYIFPLIIMFVGVVSLGLGGEGLGLGRVHMYLIGAVIIGANSVALHTNLRRYVTGIDVQGPNLNSSPEWWWATGPSPMGVWALGSAFFAVAIVGTVAYVIRADRGALAEAGATRVN